MHSFCKTKIFINPATSSRQMRLKGCKMRVWVLRLVLGDSFIKVSHGERTCFCRAAFRLSAWASYTFRSTSGASKEAGTNTEGPADTSHRPEEATPQREGDPAQSQSVVLQAHFACIMYADAKSQPGSARPEPPEVVTQQVLLMRQATS